MWCTTRKPKGSSYTRSLTKLFEHSYRSFNKQYINFNLTYIKLVTNFIFNYLKLFLTTFNVQIIKLEN